MPRQSGGDQKISPAAQIYLFSQSCWIKARIIFSSGTESVLGEADRIRLVKSYIIKFQFQGIIDLELSSALWS